MKSKFNFRQILKLLSSILFVSIISVSSAFLCVPTRDYKLDRVAYSLNDYNKKDYYNGFQPSILKLYQESKDKVADNRSERYDDIFNQFYYNSFVMHFRQYATNEIYDEIIGSQIMAYCQSTYLCRNQELNGGGHYVDFGIFASYFGDDFFQNRPQGDPRSHSYYPYNDCVTFGYISDAYADSLISYYQENEPAAEINTYADLIFKKPVLPIVALEKLKDGTTKEYRINVSINNILYSNKRHAGRISELYGKSFALIDLWSYGRKTRDFADIACEMDLKVDPYGTKNVIQGLELMGYTADNTQYNFYKYNYSSKSYSLDYSINKMYLNSYNGNVSVALFYCLSLLFVIAFYAFNYFIIRKDNKLRLFSILSYLLTLSIFGIVVSFTYFYMKWSFVPLLSLAGGIIINVSKKRKKNLKKEQDYIDVQI